MADLTHTPGPWEVEPINGGETFQITTTEATAFTVIAETPLGWGGPAEANARLMAAAPDLLEALEPFSEIDGEGDEDFGDETPVEVKFGRSTHYVLTLGDLRRARRAFANANGWSA
jgi:hypothetical protein